MEKRQYHVGLSLRQVQQFLTAHADAVPAAAASAARQQLDSAVADLDRAAIEQGGVDRAVRAEVQRRMTQERTLVMKYLTPLSKFARAMLRGSPEFAALTASCKSLERERLVRTAQSMAAAADKHAAELRQAQFPSDFLDQLRSAASAVQASFDAGVSGRVRRTGVTKEISAALAHGRRAVASLDALVAHTIVGNAALEREWRAAKRVRRSGAAEAVPPVAGTIAPAAAPEPVAREVAAAA